MLATALLVCLLAAPDVFLVVFAGILAAVFLHSGGHWIVRWTGMPHGVAVGAFAVAILLLLGGSVLAFAPAISTQFDELSREIPEVLASVRDRISEYAWGERLLDRALPEWAMSGEGTSAAASAVSTTFGALGNMVIIAFIGLYGAIAPGVYRRGLVWLVAPALRARTEEILDKLAKSLRDWLSAQLLAMAVVGVLTTLGLWLIGIPLAVLLGLIAAILAFIPNIGPILAALPAVLLALPEGMTTTLLVVGVYVVVQAVESYVITPLIQQEKVSLPPALVISAQLLLGVLFGLLGLILAMPLTAVAVTLVREAYVRDYLDSRRDHPVDLKQAPSG